MQKLALVKAGTINPPMMKSSQPCQRKCRSRMGNPSTVAPGWAANTGSTTRSSARLTRLPVASQMRSARKDSQLLQRICHS